MGAKEDSLAHGAGLIAASAARVAATRAFIADSRRLMAVARARRLALEGLWREWQDLRAEHDDSDHEAWDA